LSPSLPFISGLLFVSFLVIMRGSVNKEKANKMLRCESFKEAKSNLEQDVNLDKGNQWEKYYHDPCLGLATKARGMGRCELRVQTKSHIHILRSVRECEGMNPHIPKWSSHFRNWSPNGFSNL
jgi:hypothetical protein